jgi:hypothetical protein
MTIYLYKKTHKKTGLQYLGQTSRGDPHKYPGSGTYWNKHLKKHGYEYVTEIIKECQTKDEIKFWGKYYSELWDVVHNPSWANLKMEEGNGGTTRGMTGKTHSDDARQKMSESHKGKPSKRKGRKFDPQPPTTRLKKSIALKGNRNGCGNKGITKGPMPTEQKLLLSLATKGKPKGKQTTICCPHCSKSGGISLIKRWHFKNCKYNPHK